MPSQAPITLKTALDRIWKHDYVLPAIQREFVWKPEQIYRLFDSLMQGFPVGSFLFWKIEPETSKTFEFFDFAREYHQRDNFHCPPLGKVPDGRVTAQWIAGTYKKDDDRKDYISRHMLDGVMTNLNGFEAFYESRRKRILERIVAVLNGPTDAAEGANT
jgi:hypothetical protein